MDRQRVRPGGCLPPHTRPCEQSLINELRDHRNKWAHQQTFSGDDAYRAL
jgi:hypothetical protein